MSDLPPTDPAVTSALLDLVRASALRRAPWSLIGGQALIAYGVPRHTGDIDTLVPKEELVEFSEMLVQTFGYSPLIYSTKHDGYVIADEVTVHYMDDPVLFSVGEERELVPLRSPLGLDVELLAAQHPIEQELLDVSLPRKHYGVIVPIASLGGVLLLKSIADRPKDVAAIEQTAESLLRPQIDAALDWAEQRDPTNTEDLRAILMGARARRVPKGTRGHRSKERR